MSDPDGKAGLVRRQLAARFPRDSVAGQRLRRLTNASIATLRTIAQPLRLSLDGAHFRLMWSKPAPGIGADLRGRTIVMLVVSDVHVDPRVRQEATVLAAAGFSVVVMWPELAAKRGAAINWGANITFERLAPSAGQFAYRYPGVFGRAMLAAALTHRPFAFHGHDLTTAMIALTAARTTGAHAVCDFHEWFSEHVTWSPRRETYVPMGRAARATNKALERFCVAHASAVVTVCDSIAAAMEGEYSHGAPRIHVVRNIAVPPAGAATPYPSLRETLGLNERQSLVLYQGGVGPSRALEPVIRALAEAPDVVLAIRGPSIEAFERHYRAVAAAAGVAQARLALLPPVPSTDVIAACHGADIGLYTVADLCKSFTHALPNKVFEYMRAGLPVLTADYPEVRRMVIETGAGLGFDPQDPADIARAMRAIAQPEHRAAFIAAGQRVLADLDAAPEWPKLVHLYRRLAGDVPASAAPIGRSPSVAMHLPGGS